MQDNLLTEKKCSFPPSYILFHSISFSEMNRGLEEDVEVAASGVTSEGRRDCGGAGRGVVDGSGAAIFLFSCFRCCFLVCLNYFSLYCP